MTITKRPSLVHSQEIQERPAGYRGPNLDPQGMTLTPKALGNGVIAFVASPPPKDNGGLIFGTKAALMVDAGINSDVAASLRSLAAEVSPVPLRYLVNTTYHGDHSFGNAAFPDDVVVVSSQQNKVSMADLDAEKRIRMGNMYGNASALENVKTWRKPDVTFDTFLEIDLGDQVVELWHFGPGNAPGDTIVYSPSSKVAWTGNFLGHAGIAPMLLEGSPGPYIASLRAMQEMIDVRTIVPGHGPLADAPEAIAFMIHYLEWLAQQVDARLQAGDSEAQAIENVAPPPFLKTPDGAPPQLDQLNVQMHRLNVMAAYRAL